MRLILPKIRHSSHHHSTSTKLENKESTTGSSSSKMAALMEQLNASTAGLRSGRSCPLSIVSRSDIYTNIYV